MLVVLFAALLHACWNALVKASPDKGLDVVAVAGGAALVSAVGLPLVPAPAPASWPCLAASVAIHVAYFRLIAAAYHRGDMGHAYPLMRGTAPLLVALAGGLVLGERLSAGAWGGVVLISGGVLALVLAGRVEARSGGTGHALANACVIALYTLVDGTGVRLAGTAAGYTMWMLMLTAPAVVAVPLLRRRPALLVHLQARWAVALLGGACTLSAYVLVLWAMTRAPVAVVAALRETAIVFGVAISAFVLKERAGAGRWVASAAILCGVAAIRLG